MNGLIPSVEFIHANGKRAMYQSKFERVRDCVVGFAILAFVCYAFMATVVMMIELARL